MLKKLRPDKIYETEVKYKGAYLCIHYKICSDYFEHELGQEKLPANIEFEQAFCDTQDIGEILSDNQVEDIVTLVAEDLYE